MVEEKSAKKTPKSVAPPSPQPPAEDISGLGLDEQLVVHTYNLAIAAVFSRVSRPAVCSTRALYTSVPLQMTGELKAIELASQEAAKFAKPPSEPENVKSADSKDERGKGKKEVKEKVCTCMCMCVRMCVCVCTCMCVRMCVCMCMCMCTYMCVCVCMCVLYSVWMGTGDVNIF